MIGLITRIDSFASAATVDLDQTPHRGSRMKMSRRTSYPFLSSWAAIDRTASRRRVPVTTAPPRSGVGRGRHLGIPAGRRLLLVLADDQPGTCRCWTCKRRTTSHL